MIYLYRLKGEELVAAKQYKSPGVRKEIIATWKKLYSAAYDNCFLQISPMVNSLKVNGRGLNTKYQY